MQNLNIPVAELLDEQTKLSPVLKNANDLVIRSLCVDSRKIKKGDWFICLRGANFDGHDFIEAALASGAVGIIYDRNDVQIPDDCPTVKVPDTIWFLGKIASWWRKSINPVVIAVTGSNGKTSVKELIYFLLEKCAPGQVCQSAGNFNNQFGVPYTLLSLEPRHRFLVVEIGTNHPGEIAPLSVLAQPDFAVITSVSQGHIGNFGSMESIVDEKSEIIAGMKPSGILILNPDLSKNPLVLEKVAGRGIGIKTPGDSIRLQSDDETGMHFLLDGETYHYPVCGIHQFQNLSLVYTLLCEIIKTGGDALKKNPADRPFEQATLKTALLELKNYRPVKGRLQKTACETYNVWDDTYNANPASYREAIKFISRISQETGGPRASGAFGMMGELGDFTLNAHEELGRLAAESGFDCVFFSAPDEKIREAFLKGWQSSEASKSQSNKGPLNETNKPQSNVFAAGNSDDDILAGYNFLRSKMKMGGYLLVKGSRSTRMERILKFL